MTKDNKGLFEVKWGIDPAKIDWIDELLLEHGIENWSILEDAITPVSYTHLTLPTILRV